MMRALLAAGLLVLATGPAAAHTGHSHATAAASAPVSFGWSPRAERRLADLYGERERPVLEAMLRERLARALPPGVARVEVNILDVIANRPTMDQMSRNPGLSYMSFGAGGAEVEGRAFAADGRQIALVRHRWFETSIETTLADWTWADADRAFRRFSVRLAEASVTPDARPHATGR